MKELSESKKRILDVAFGHFSDIGYDLTSMSQVANDVGIKKSSLYSHFKNKEQMFLIIFNRILLGHKNFVNDMFLKSQNFKIKERLKYIFLEYLYYCINNIDICFWNRIYFSPPKDFKEKILDDTKQIEDIIIKNLRTIFDEGIKKEELVSNNIDSMVYVFYNTQLGFILSIENYTNRDIKIIFEKCFEIIWNGLKKNS